MYFFESEIGKKITCPILLIKSYCTNFEVIFGGSISLIYSRLKLIFVHQTFRTTNMKLGEF